MNDAQGPLNDFINNILKRKELVVSLLILIVGSSFAWKLNKEQNGKIRQFENTIAQEEQKIAVAKEVAGLHEKKTQMSDPYDKSNNSLNLDSLSHLATAHKVKVLLLDPLEQQDMGVYVVSSFAMELKADYFSIASFISAAESQPGIIRIEEMSLRKEESRPMQTDKNLKKDVLKAVLKISELSLKK